MKQFRLGQGLTLALVAGALTAQLAWAAEGDKKPTPPARGVVQNVSDTELTIKPMGGRNAQANAEQPKTFKLTGDTVFRQVVAGQASDLAQDTLVAAIGKLDGANLNVRAAASYVPAQGEAPAVSQHLIALIGGTLRMAAGRPQQGAPAEKLETVVGSISKTNPLTLTTRDGKEICLVAADTTRYLKLDTAQRSDVAVGRLVLVASTEADATTAAAVIQMPQMGGRGNRGNRANRANRAGHAAKG